MVRSLGNGPGPYNLPVGERGRTARAGLVIAFGGFVLLTWLPRAWSGRWIADDYCFAVSSLRDGFWRSQALVYNSAAGRYSVAFLYAAITRLGTWTAPVLSIGAMAVWLVASWCTARYAFRALGVNATRLEEFATAIGFVAAVVNAAPDVYQPLIWTGGLFTYGVPVIAAAVIAAIILRSASARIAVLVAILAFIFGGCSEVAAVAQIAFSGSLAVVSRRARRLLVAVAIGSTLALIIVGIAPGNLRRRALFQPLPVPAAAMEAVAKTPQTFAAILIEGSTLFVPLVGFLALAGGARLPRRYAAATLVASISVVTATLFGGLAGTGRLPWGRVQFVPVAYVAVALVFAALSMRLDRYAVIATGAIVVFGLAGIIGTTETRMQTIRDARQFAAAADGVEKAARADSGSAVIIPAPRTFEYLDYLAADPGHWTNRCIADYYGLQSIRSRR